MVKVINISSRTVEIAGVEIKPHTGKIFKEMSLKDRQRLSAMSAVGIVKAYDGDYSEELKAENTVNQKPKTVSSTVNRKSTRRTNRKK